MSHSSQHRGQVEPVAALVAVFAVTIVLGLYAGVFADVRPSDPNPSATPTLQRVIHAISKSAIVHPTNLTTATLDAVTPHGVTVSVRLRTANHTWHIGPPTPAKARSSRQSVPVATDGGVVPGRIQVVVWP